MIFTKMKNYKIFTRVGSSQWSWLVGLTMLALAVSAFNVRAEQANNSKLLGISYNTIQDDQIKLVFDFSNELSALPVVQTSMSPAYIEISFMADSYDEKLTETLVNHAGITNVSLDDSSGKVVALIKLEKLSVFDVALNEKQFSITFNYGQSAEVVETLSPAGEQFINHV